mgnify:CR=1 FL=1
MSNLTLWDKFRKVPASAQKEIRGGRLKGMTDINPLYRFKTLTEHFGVCGVGWKYEITDKRLEQGANNEIAAFVDINLYISDGISPDERKWSEPIPGTGGSMLVAKEKAGLYTSDECFKMALTDAISVACKALGIGADVYWEKDATKYSRQGDKHKQPAQQNKPKGQSTKPACESCGAPITSGAKTLSTKKYGKALCPECQSKEGK